MMDKLFSWSADLSRIFKIFYFVGAASLSRSLEITRQCWASLPVAQCCHPRFGPEGFSGCWNDVFNASVCCNESDWEESEELEFHLTVFAGWAQRCEGRRDIYNEKHPVSWQNGVWLELWFFFDFVRKNVSHPNYKVRREYKRGYDPSSPIRYRMPELLTRTADGRPLPKPSRVRILDAGSGPWSILGYTWPGVDVEVIGADSLACEWTEMHRDLGISPPDNFVLKAADAEDLVGAFGESSFDAVLAKNAFDHMMDPLKALVEMLRAVKPGGPVKHRHRQNCGERRSYIGLAQWNLDVSGQRLIVWRPAGDWGAAESIDLEDRLLEMGIIDPAGTEVYIDDDWNGESHDDPGGRIVSVFYRPEASPFSEAQFSEEALQRSLLGAQPGAENWQHVALDVAIIGFPKCGSHTLAAVFRQFADQAVRHPSGSPMYRIPPDCSDSLPGRAPCDTEDYFFHKFDEHDHFHRYYARAAPTLSEVTRFNDRSWDEPAEVKAAAARNGRPLRFVQESPVIAYNTGALRGMARVPGLRVVVVVRDPAEQFVSFYNDEFVNMDGDMPSLREAVTHASHYRSEPVGPFKKFHTIVQRDGGRFSSRLTLMRQLFGRRLHLVHIDELVSAPERVLAGLQDFLQLGTNASLAGLLDRVPKVHARSASWSPLCQAAPGGEIPECGLGVERLCGAGSESAELRRDLVAMLKDEYDALYSTPGAPFPHLRRGPCEGPVPVSKRM
mmetsp:Transcript_41115/g.118809  ORF Transcript_41115/g.118809 Transcript_41115/m.118809 type:complete len:727 (-) Transcript_41115:66-2246(-)